MTTKYLVELIYFIIILFNQFFMADYFHCLYFGAIMESTILDIDRNMAF